MWTLSPILLVLGLLASSVVGIGAALGPLDALTMHIPAGLLVCAGLSALVGQTIYPPTAYRWRLFLYIYTIPTILLGGYSFFVVAHSGYLAATNEMYLHVQITSSHDYTTVERGVLKVLKGCMTDWKGNQTTSDSDACVYRFYIYIHPPPAVGWDYAGGGAFIVRWKQLDDNGFITPGSDEKVLTLQYKYRGPVLAIDGNDFPLQNGDLIVVNLGKDWKPHVTRGHEALDKLTMPFARRQRIIKCVASEYCRFP